MLSGGWSPPLVNLRVCCVQVFCCRSKRKNDWNTTDGAFKDLIETGITGDWTCSSDTALFFCTLCYFKCVKSSTNGSATLIKPSLIIVLRSIVALRRVEKVKGHQEKVNLFSQFSSRTYDVRERSCAIFAFVTRISHNSPSPWRQRKPYSSREFDFSWFKNRTRVSDLRQFMENTLNWRFHDDDVRGGGASAHHGSSVLILCPLNPFTVFYSFSSIFRCIPYFGDVMLIFFHLICFHFNISSLFCCVLFLLN